MSERSCACGCGTRLTHLRFGAVWASESCRKAFLRGRAPANASKSRPRPSGLQYARRAANESLALWITATLHLPDDDARTEAERILSPALSSRARETLEQRQEAA